MALLDEVRARLIAQSVGVSGSTASWCVTMDYMPASPDRAIALYETGGFPNDRGQGLQDRPTFQVIIRGPRHGYSTARTKMSAARTALDGIGPVTLSGRRYTDLEAQGEPLSLGPDQNERPRVSMNFTAYRSRS